MGRSATSGAMACVRSQLDTTGSLTGYPGNLDSPAPAGVVNLAIRTPVGRDLTLGLSQRVSYEPLFNVLSPGAGGTPLPPGVAQPTPTTGLFERNSWSSSSSVSLDRRWGRRDTTSLAYSYRTQQFLDDDYGDNTWHELTGGYRRVVSSQAKAGADYRYRNGEYVDSSAVRSPHHRAQDRRRGRVRGGTVAPPQLHAVARGGCRLPRVGQP